MNNDKKIGQTGEIIKNAENITRKFGLLGYPLGHSLSGFIHKRIFELSGTTNCEYNLHEIKPEELSIKGNSVSELMGFNVTIPYKTAIIPHVDKLDETAEEYGSINCVMFHEESDENVGYNTDGYGFLKALEKLGVHLDENSRVLLLGCGGTGRMMAVEVIKTGAELTLAIRKTPSEQKKAAALSREIMGPSGLKNKNGQFVTAVLPPLRNGMPKNTLPPARRMRITFMETLNKSNHYDLILNATPCGMYPNVDESPIFPDVLTNANYLFDAVYNPICTKLMKQAEERGVKTLNGVTMLVYQAIMSEKIWNNITINDNDAETIIKEVTEQLLKGKT